VPLQRRRCGGRGGAPPVTWSRSGGEGATGSATVSVVALLLSSTCCRYGGTRKQRGSCDRDHVFAEDRTTVVAHREAHAWRLADREQPHRFLA